MSSDFAVVRNTISRPTGTIIAPPIPWKTRALVNAVSAGAAGAMIVASRFSMKYAPAMSTASARENPGPDPLLGAGGLDGELGSVKSPPDCSSPRHHVERRRGGDHPGNTGPQDTNRVAAKGTNRW